MGLDAGYYTKVRKVDIIVDAEGVPMNPVTGEFLFYLDFVQVDVRPGFEWRADDLENGAYYEYETTGSFHAGWLGDATWREDLARLAGYELSHDEDEECRSYRASAIVADTGPFVEFLRPNGPDGVFGPRTCAKLANDFAKYQAMADAQWNDNSQYLRDYTWWHDAFDAASNDGMVKFSY